MIITFENWDAERWKNFTPEEFACQETRTLAMDSVFLDKLQSLRTALDFALPVVSGYRSPDHSAEKDKENGPGPHGQGVAVDVAVTSGLRLFKLLSAFSAHGFTGIGINNGSVHLDTMFTRPEAPRPSSWTYY